MSETTYTNYARQATAGSGQVALTTSGNGYYDIIHWEYAGGFLFVTNDGTVH